MILLPYNQREIVLSHCISESFSYFSFQIKIYTFQKTSSANDTQYVVELHLSSYQLYYL